MNKDSNATISTLKSNNKTKLKTKKSKYIIRGFLAFIIILVFGFLVWILIRQINRIYPSLFNFEIKCSKLKCEENLLQCKSCMGEYECKNCLLRNRTECEKCVEELLEKSFNRSTFQCDIEWCNFYCRSKYFENGYCELVKLENVCICNPILPIQKCQSTHHWNLKYKLCKVNDILTLKNHSSEVKTLAILLNGYLAAGSNDYSISIWNTFESKLERKLIGHEYFITSLVVFANGDLASGSFDRTIKIWNTTDGSLKKTLEEMDSIYSLVVLNNGDLASGSTDSFITIWDLRTEKPNIKLAGHEQSVLCLTKLPNGDLVSGSSDEKIIIWNADDYKMKKVIKSEGHWIYSLIAISNDLLISGTSDKDIKLWDLKEEKVLKSFIDHTNSILSLTVLKNGDLASGSRDKKINIWNMTTCVVKKTLVGHLESVNALAVLPNGDLASASDDYTIKIWNTE